MKNEQYHPNQHPSYTFSHAISSTFIHHLLDNFFIEVIWTELLYI